MSIGFVPRKNRCCARQETAPPFRTSSRSWVVTKALRFELATDFFPAASSSPLSPLTMSSASSPSSTIEGRRLLQVQEETGTFVLSEIRHKVEAPETPAPPSSELTPPPARFERDVESQSTPVEASDGFTLADVYDWFARLWNTVRGWFGGSRKTALEEPKHKITPTKAPARAPVPAAEPSQVESVDAPSWSLKHDSQEARERSQSSKAWAFPLGL